MQLPLTLSSDLPNGRKTGMIAFNKPEPASAPSCQSMANNCPPQRKPLDGFPLQNREFEPIMPRSLRLSDGSYMRRLDIHNLLHYLYGGECVQLVGFSNVGKSSLLRLIAQPDVWTQELGEAGQDFLAVY